MSQVAYEVAIQAHIERCLIAISVQEDIVRALSLTNKHELRESAERTLASMYRSLEVARTAQISHTLSLRRKLCYDLMVKFAKRGALLSTLSRAEMAIVARDTDLSEFSAWACIELHRNWRNFVLAERWNHEMGESPPTTVDEAVLLMRKWKVLGQSS